MHEHQLPTACVFFPLFTAFHFLLVFCLFFWCYSTQLLALQPGVGRAKSHQVIGNEQPMQRQAMQSQAKAPVFFLARTGLRCDPNLPYLVWSGPT